jgi:hypothetical protein
MKNENRWKEKFLTEVTVHAESVILRIKKEERKVCCSQSSWKEKAFQAMN